MASEPVIDAKNKHISFLIFNILTVFNRNIVFYFSNQQIKVEAYVKFLAFVKVS